METTLTFLGTGSAVPEAGNDTASYLINGHVLVDCGWSAPLRLIGLGANPLDADHVLFTHLHHDHYLGLAQLLFHRAMRGADRPPLRIVGPAADVGRVVDLAWAFIQADRFFPAARRPEVTPLEPGAAVDAGELRVRTAPAVHPVQAMSLRIADTRTGAEIGLSGDTAYEPALGAFFFGVRVLIHECSLGPRRLPREKNPSLHSGAADAAAVARVAGAGALYLVHGNSADREASLAAARAEFPATYWAPVLQTLRLGAATAAVAARE